MENTCVDQLGRVPKMVIISGLPCTGKSTIAAEISTKYNLPLVRKDDLKESLFDSLGWSDREWSKKLGMATYPILYYFIESQLAAGRSFIIESNFHPKFDSVHFQKLQKKYSFDSILVQCECDGEVLLDRFIKRSNSGERHEGHRDHLNVEEFRDKLLSGKIDLLDIDAEVFKLDTTDFSQIANQNLEKFLNQRL